MNWKNLNESSLYEILDNISDVMYNLHFKTTPYYIKEDIKQFMMMKCLNTLKIGAYDPQYCVRNYFMSCCRNAGSVYVYHSNKLSICYDISDSQVPELTTTDEEPLIIYSQQIYDICKPFSLLYGDVTSMIIDILKVYGIDVTYNHKDNYVNPYNVKESKISLNTLQRILGIVIWELIKEGI